MRSLLLILLIAVTAMSHAQSTELPQEVRRAWQEKLQNSEQYLIQLVDAVPEDQLGYTYKEGKMTISEQVLHIAGNINWLTGKYLNGTAPNNMKPQTKDGILTYLSQSFAAATQAFNALDDKALMEDVDFFAGRKSRYQIAQLLQDHLTHHRGQLLVYLGLLDIPAPNYTGW